MEYNNLATFERLSGKAFFQPKGQTGMIDLGNIDMMKLDYNPKTVEIPLASRGRLALARRDTFQVTPVYQIDGNQFATPIIPLLLLGDQLADIVQTSGSAQVFSFTAKAGLAFYIGARGVTNVVVKVAGVTKTPDVDYFLDDYNGIIKIPVTPVGISDGATVDVTFDKPAITFEQFQAFTKLNRQGTLIVHEEDEYGPPALNIWTMQVQLTVKTGPNKEPDKFSKFSLEASLFGTPTMVKRKA